MTEPDEPARGRLRIDLEALASNWRALGARMASGSCAGIVKADAYGLGVDRVAPALHRAGCRLFFVAQTNEALTLRRLLSDVDIAVLGPVLASDLGLLHRHRIMPVLNSAEDVSFWRDRGEGLPAILHIDTGMTRLGLSPFEVDSLAARPGWRDGLNLRLVMTHFACADEAANPETARQAAAFDAARARLGLLDVPSSLANSPGLFHAPECHGDVARPGMAVYGLNPTPHLPNPMRRVVTLEVPVLQVRPVDRRLPVGYGAAAHADAPQCLITVSAGYADGLLRAAGANAAVYWHGQRCPLVGRISMDLIVADVTHLAGPRPVPGDLVELLGPHQDADALADAAGTIGYEVLTRLGPRYRRVYWSGSNDGQTNIT